mmetsp:Transcript_34481/g.90315  ORF Transcript_34481/g.90315 Transcript_34481/m.90315 type:complete len:201 (+) Transcript_34481:3-605(+)
MARPSCPAPQPARAAPPAAGGRAQVRPAARRLRLVGLSQEQRAGGRVAAADPRGGVVGVVGLEALQGRGVHRHDLVGVEVAHGPALVGHLEQPGGGGRHEVDEAIPPVGAGVRVDRQVEEVEGPDEAGLVDLRQQHPLGILVGQIAHHHRRRLIPLRRRGHRTSEDDAGVGAHRRRRPPLLAATLPSAARKEGPWARVAY